MKFHFLPPSPKIENLTGGTLIISILKSQIFGTKIMWQNVMFEKSLNIMNSSFKNSYSVSLDFSLWVKFLEFWNKFALYNCKNFLFWGATPPRTDMFLFYLWACALKYFSF